jgi:hypothetical protein
VRLLGNRAGGRLGRAGGGIIAGSAGAADHGGRQTTYEEKFDCVSLELHFGSFQIEESLSRISKGDSIHQDHWHKELVSWTWRQPNSWSMV